jgi:hypothetical protein
VGEILLAGEEAQEGASAMGDVVADSPAQYRITRLKGVKDRALGRLALNVERHLAIDPRQGP